MRSEHIQSPKTNANEEHNQAVLNMFPGREPWDAAPDLIVHRETKDYSRE